MRDRNNVYTSKEDLVKQILDKDKNLEGSNIDEELIHQLISGKISNDINNTHDENLTLGQRTADKIALFGGSWKFIIAFGVVLASWIILNAVILSNNSFDSYPFVFLNLILSCLAAIQAPVIMMSQNRQTEKDRLTASNDYLVNLKSEIIVEDLHNKIDLLICQQEQYKKDQEMLLKIIEELKDKTY
ncbi:DUF1003 domain-containing protein [Clostridium algidicarnis]|nr:DUF1003 domain-containing protein [Clostridium algidicarnis]MBU3195343.1 DUF1003 domain-containing protein [Clostridium algidicarnis]MBU3208302.1 DUF1003 domain-containing protein [Clostridium algidicarnis]MBU3227466.1 DUF1003 domain-containing protein [Clostridium algidicarnis]MBU3251127.1 DUF1003 domain-containing protein [Clostridium algidicarnis]